MNLKVSEYSAVFFFFDKKEKCNEKNRLEIDLVNDLIRQSLYFSLLL